MAKTSKAKNKDQEKTAQANIQKRVEGLFMGEEFPASASISQVEALKARIAELEAMPSKQQFAGPIPSVTSTEFISSQFESLVATDLIADQHTHGPSQGKDKFFRDLLRAPKFGNSTQDRIAGLQQNILLGLLATALMGLGVSLAFWTERSIYGLSVLIFEFLLTLVAFYWQRHGYLGRTSWVLVIEMYLVFLLAFALAGFSFPIGLILALAISLAGLLLPYYSVIAVSVFSILTLWVVPYIVAIPLTVKSNELVYASIILALQGLLLTVASRVLEKSFSDVDLSTQALRHTNQNLQNMTLNLEKRVGERTHDLELVIDVSQAVSGKSANLSSLLREAVELIRERFDLYYTQIYLVDPSERLLIMQAGTGNAGAELLRRDHRLSIASGSLNGRAAAEKQAIVVVDTHQNANFLPNPLLPNTRSEMAVPLIFGEKIVGVLDMQSEYPGALNEVNLPAFEALAGQLAVAIQNAWLFAEIEAARLNVESQVRRTSEQGWLDFLNSTDRGQKLGFAFDQTQVIQLKKDDLKPLPARSALNVPIQVTGAHVGMIQVANEPDRVWTNAETGLLKATAEQLAQHIENLRLLDQADKYRLEAEDAVRRLTREGWGTYLQTHKTETVGFAFDLIEVYSLSEKGADTQSSATVHPLTIRDEIVGEFSINSSYGPQDDVSELLSAVTSQLSEHIENLRLTEQTQSALNETETLYQASAELNIAANYIEVLDVLRRYTLLGNNAHIVSLNYFDRPWVGDAEPDWIDVLARWTTLTSTSAASRYGLSSLPSASQILFPDVPTLIEDVFTDPRMDAMVRALYTDQFGAKSTIFIPLVIGGQWLGYINAMYPQSTLFPESDIRQLMTLAGQAAVAINNLRLLIMTQERVKREQALRQITTEMRGSTDPATIMRTAVRELGNMLGRKTVVQLLTSEQANLAGPTVTDVDKSDSPARQS